MFLGVSSVSRAPYDSHAKSLAPTTPGPQLPSTPRKSNTPDLNPQVVGLLNRYIGQARKKAIVESRFRKSQTAVRKVLNSMPFQAASALLIVAVGSCAYARAHTHARAMWGCTMRCTVVQSQGETQAELL